jgi:glyoxylase-like metal-dependent hydrolase (beta-lactamase superfamily II)
MFRRVLGVSILLVALAGDMPTQADEAKPSATKSSTPSLLQNQAGFRFMVGDLEVTALSDGSVPLECYGTLTNIERQKIEQLLDDANEKSPVETSINAFLIKDGTRVILIDTGSGDIFGPKMGGLLIPALAASGVQPDKVTDICITHVHSDHSGGLTRGGERLFKNAKVHIGKPDVDFFLNAANAEKSGYAKKFFDEAIKTVKPYADAGQIDAITRDGEIIPRIKATLIGGHTPGSTIYTVESKGQRIVFTGDIVHVAAVQLPHPDVTVVFDVDSKAALRNRTNHFKKWASERTLIAIPHLNYPGVGYLKADGEGYRWMPIAFSNRAND